MELAFTGEVVEWRGPAPHLFVALPEPAAAAIADVAPMATYGWGCIPVSASVGGLDFETSLFPRHGGYLLPLKVAVRRPLGIEVGDEVAVELRVQLRG